MGELIWPIVLGVCIIVIAIVFLKVFRTPIEKKIGDLKSVRANKNGITFEMVDITHDIFKRREAKPSPQIIQPEGITVEVAVGEPTIIQGKPELSIDEIEKAKKRHSRGLMKILRRLVINVENYINVLTSRYGVSLGK